MTQCLVCHQDTVTAFLDLGQSCLANKFLTEAELDQPEPTFPLRLGFCSHCGHVQLMDQVPPADMFAHYLYISSMSDTLVRHLHGLAQTVCKRLSLGDDDLVLDIGCNDGTLLEGFLNCGVKTLGIDPATNLAARAKARGVSVVTDFFGQKSAEKIRQQHGPAQAITMTNTFPHVPDLRDILRGLELMLAPGGQVVIEAHYLLDLMEQRAFDTVYHEHVHYWALRPLMRLFESAGFEVIDVERLPIHHGQLRVFAARQGAYEVSGTVHALAQAEIDAGMDKLESWQSFAEEIAALKNQVNHCLEEILARGETVAAYGAPAKGTTLISYFGLTADKIKFIADRSPLKQGRFTPGAHIPVVEPERLAAEQPDYALLLAWNFADEIIAQQAEYCRQGGRFITPVPEFRVQEQ